MLLLTPADNDACCCLMPADVMGLVVYGCVCICAADVDDS
jgi:hypothetical protein